MKIYVGGKMRGLPNFGHQAFRNATESLRAQGHEVFSPVENAEAIYGPALFTDNPEGDEARAGVDGNRLFLDDLTFICRHAEVVALLPNWKESRGATAERAVADALGLEVIEL